MDIILTVLAVINIILLFFAIYFILKLTRRVRGSGRKELIDIQKKIDIIGNTAEKQNRLIMEQLVRMNESLVYQLNTLGPRYTEQKITQKVTSIPPLHTRWKF